ncbi:hypothetical protein E4O04_12700 [Treponema sp. OMZ 799]|uniref:hypothetical protein n=1 Tax=Treponema sp. OMZ 799 TaxID=2563668 RepID=UPI0020A3B2D0|nr:hypothetical protein [Treponema sp. OMZ 799]UTC78808.1 hypothetical protein E4O04_12700 [Treponema sp. OMZ 799]
MHTGVDFWKNYMDRWFGNELIAEWNKNVKVEYARKNFTGKVFLGGAGMGGPLAYACDARYNLADGLICWCLWDFPGPHFPLKKETYRRWAKEVDAFIKEIEPGS